MPSQEHVLWDRLMVGSLSCKDLLALRALVLSAHPANWDPAYQRHWAPSGGTALPSLSPSPLPTPLGCWQLLRGAPSRPLRRG